MTIGAISSVYSYSSSYQISVFGTNISSAKIQELMAQYGITPTGDEYADLTALYAAMYGDAKETVRAAAAEKIGKNEPIVTSSTQVPWEKLMSQVRLETTGIVALDYAAFNERIFQMQGTARSKQDEANIFTLMAEANIVFNQQTQQVDITGNGATKPQAISGADILAQLNRTFALS